MENLDSLIPIFAILVGLVAVVGGLLLEYQKNKTKMIEVGKNNEQEVDKLHEVVNTLKTRVENLEAIAAVEPDELKPAAGSDMKEIEIDEPTTKGQNKDEVSTISNNLRSK